MATALYCALLLLLSSYLTVSFAVDDDLLITTKNGKVQGKVLSALGGEVRAFLGIPYAKPPLGKLRFRPPQPADSWEGVKNVTRFPNACHQIGDKTLPGKLQVYTEGKWSGGRKKETLSVLQDFSIYQICVAIKFGVLQKDGNDSYEVNNQEPIVSQIIVLRSK